MSKKNSDSKKTKAISGAKQKAYLSQLFAAEPGLSEEGARALLETCSSEIAQIRVRLPVPERGRAKPPPQAKGQAEPGTEPDGTSDTFDPFQFSVVVVLTKEGREGLERKLASAGSAGRLRALAKAQHIPVPGELTKVSEIIAAIVAGTEQRIADRKAAAS